MPVKQIHPLDLYDILTMPATMKLIRENKAHVVCGKDGECFVEVDGNVYQRNLGVPRGCDDAR